MKYFMLFINSIYWCAVFIVPAGSVGLFAYWVYFNHPQYLWIAVILGIAGIAAGILAAEYVRKRYGLDNFFGRIHATPDIDDGNILDERHHKKDDNV